MNLAAARVVDPILTTVVQGYRQPEFIGEKLFPRVPVMISGGKILEFNKESFKRYKTLRVPGGAIARVQFGYQGKDFSLENHALAGTLPYEHLRDARVQPGIDLARRALSLPMKIHLLELEIAQAAIALNPANYDNDHKIALAGGDKWSDDTSVPGKQIAAYREEVRKAIGIYPNLLVLSALAFAALRENPSIIDRFKYVSKESITAEMLAQLFDVSEVVVGKGVYSNDSGVNQDVWGNNALLGYVPPSPSGMEEPSYGYTYVMENHPMAEEPYYDKDTKTWVYPVSFERKPVLSGMVAGFLIQNPK